MIPVRPAWSFDATSAGPVLPSGPQGALSPDSAWGNSTGTGVRVAIVDSGVDNAHPAIAGAVKGWVEPYEADGKLRFRTEPHEDSSGHGTACAGIVLGLAPDVELYSIKVLGGTMSGTGALFAAGLHWAIENGMQLVNLSLGTTKRDFYPILHELADSAYFRRVVLVAAANNLPVPSFPSLYASVISVASQEDPDPLHFCYNPSPPVEFSAPGIDVEVAWSGGTYVRSTGNSFAAPHIAGLVARILGQWPHLTPFQVKTILRATAYNVRDRASA
jgi:subtilisin family serine protease